MDPMSNKFVGSPKRLGIMGGTFDPLHYGHLVAAEMARHEFSLEKVVFIPTGNAPHKIGRRITAPRDRYEMVKRAIADNVFLRYQILKSSGRVIPIQWIPCVNCMESTQIMNFIL